MFNTILLTMVFIFFGRPAAQTKAANHRTMKQRVWEDESHEEIRTVLDEAKERAEFGGWIG